MRPVLLDRGNLVSRATAARSLLSVSAETESSVFHRLPRNGIARQDQQASRRILLECRLRPSLHERIQHGEVSQMFLFQNASDDQIALLGCLAALAGSMAIMYVSYFVGPAGRQARAEDSQQATRPFPNRSANIPSETIQDRAA